jgi:outer membrane protein OmpA-like peptidoglycan-associated protein
MFSALFSQVMGYLDLLKPSTLEKLGSYGDWVSWIGQAIAAGLAVLMLAVGRWAPPVPAMPSLPARGLAIIVAVCLLLMRPLTSKVTATVNLWQWCFILLGAGLALSLVYLVVKSVFTFSCDGDPTIRVVGFWLKQQARYVLQGQVAKLKPPYILHRLPSGELDIPPNTKDFFCRSAKAPDFVWQEWSVHVTRAFLVLVFWLAMAPWPLALFAGSAALTQADLKEDSRSITLPSDVLFAFNSADIRETAANSLAHAAETIRAKKISHARIEGHTDGRGDADYNLDLSRRRAKAVKDWLVDKEKLGNVAFDVVGYGKANPVADEKTPDKRDDPQGREKNRRVEIQLLQ